LTTNLEYQDKLALTKIYDIEEISEYIDTIFNFCKQEFGEAIEHGELVIKESTKATYRDSQRVVKVYHTYVFTWDLYYNTLKITVSPHNNKTPISIEYETKSIYNITDSWAVDSLQTVIRKISGLSEKAKSTFKKRSNWTICKELQVQTEELGIKTLTPKGKKRHKNEIFKDLLVTLMSFCKGGVIKVDSLEHANFTKIFNKAHYGAIVKLRNAPDYFYVFNTEIPQTNYHDSEVVSGTCPFSKIRRTLNGSNLSYAGYRDYSDIEIISVDFYNKDSKKVLSSLDKSLCSLCSFQLNCELNRERMPHDYKVNKQQFVELGIEVV
jgi:hypothetical protein